MNTNTEFLGNLNFDHAGRLVDGNGKFLEWGDISLENIVKELDGSWTASELALGQFLGARLEHFSSVGEGWETMQFLVELAGEYMQPKGLAALFIALGGDPYRDGDWLFGLKPEVEQEVRKLLGVAEAQE